MPPGRGRPPRASSPSPRLRARARSSRLPGWCLPEPRRRGTSRRGSAEPARDRQSERQRASLSSLLLSSPQGTRITTHYTERARVPRLGASSPSVIDRTRRLGLKDANEMRRDELLVTSEVEAVAPRNRGGDATERRRERGDNHRVGHFL